MAYLRLVVLFFIVLPHTHAISPRALHCVQKYAGPTLENQTSTAQIDKPHTIHYPASLQRGKIQEIKMMLTIAQGNFTFHLVFLV